LVFAVVAVLAVGLTLYAKGGDSDRDQVTLRFWVYGQAELYEVWKRIGAAYEQKNPAVKVELSHVPGFNEYFSKLLVSIAAGNAPDVVFMNSVQVPAFVDRGALLPIELGDASADESADDFYPEAVDLFRYRDVLWAAPSDLAIYVLYYNPDLFDAAGIDYPDDDWTWSDLIKAARELTIIDESNAVKQFGLIRGNPYLWIWQNGGQLCDDTGRPTEGRFDSPSVIEALTVMRDLEWKYRVGPPSASRKEMDAEQMFKSGQVAMIVGGHWWLPSFSRSTLRFDAAMLPVGRERASYFAGSGFSVLSSSAHPEAAAELARYFAGPEAQQMLAELNFGFPARQSVAQSATFLEGVPGLSKDAFLKSVEHLQPAPRTPHFNQIDSVIWSGLESVWTLQQTPAQCAADLDAAIDRILGSQVGGGDR
jgi:multiple sugar transport system substrate-binding protein